MRTTSKPYLQPPHVKAFNFIKGYVEKNAYAPEIAEIAKGIKASERNAHRLVHDLCRMKYLSKIAYRKRSIKIVRDITAE